MKIGGIEFVFILLAGSVIAVAGGGGGLRIDSDKGGGGGAGLVLPRGRSLIDGGNPCNDLYPDSGVDRDLCNKFHAFVQGQGLKVGVINSIVDLAVQLSPDDIQLIVDEFDAEEAILAMGDDELIALLLPCLSCRGTPDYPDACAGSTNLEVGCNSCNGQWACLNADNSFVGDNACLGNDSCKGIQDSVVSDNSCTCESCASAYSCRWATKVSIGRNSCWGKGSCSQFNYSQEETQQIGEGSCHGTHSCSNDYRTSIGDGSCNGVYACFYSHDVTISNNACQGYMACCGIKTDVGIDECNGDQECCEPSVSSCMCE